MIAQTLLTHRMVSLIRLLSRFSPYSYYSHYPWFAGTLEAQAIMPALPFNKGMASKFILYLSGQNDMFWHDVEYAGGTSNWQVRNSETDNTHA
jgi:hypothetical protein